MPYRFIYSDMLARYIKQKQTAKFYGRLETKYNKTMNDKKISTEKSENITEYLEIKKNSYKSNIRI